tara:strand:+ start:156 stop:323 length:168 start_codon:yes stop_codon:yes gene_type:complete
MVLAYLVVLVVLVADKLAVMVVEHLVLVHLVRVITEALRRFLVLLAAAVAAVLAQ